MKCAGCNKEFDGLKNLMAHKPNCPTPAITTRQKKEMRAQQNQTANEPIKEIEEQVTNEPTTEERIIVAAVEQIDPLSNDLFIPLSMCPEEIQLYAKGHIVGLRVTGILTPTGVKIQEVTLIR